MEQPVEIDHEMIRCRWKAIADPNKCFEMHFKCRLCGRIETNPDLLDRCPFGCEAEVEKARAKKKHGTEIAPSERRRSNCFDKGGMK